MNEGIFTKIYEIVRQIPKGKVMTYGQIATLIGYSRGARVVGWALHNNPNPSQVPCHRVVNSKGEISSGFAFGGPETQRQMLEKEGIIFNLEGKIDLEKYEVKIDGF